MQPFEPLRIENRKPVKPNVMVAPSHYYAEMLDAQIKAQETSERLSDSKADRNVERCISLEQYSLIGRSTPNGPSCTRNMAYNNTRPYVQAFTDALPVALDSLGGAVVGYPTFNRDALLKWLDLRLVDLHCHNHPFSQRLAMISKASQAQPIIDSAMHVDSYKVQFGLGFTVWGWNVGKQKPWTHESGMYYTHARLRVIAYIRLLHGRYMELLEKSLVATDCLEFTNVFILPR